MVVTCTITIWIIWVRVLVVRLTIVIVVRVGFIWITVPVVIVLTHTAIIIVSGLPVRAASVVINILFYDIFGNSTLRTTECTADITTGSSPIVITCISGLMASTVIFIDINQLIRPCRQRNNRNGQQNEQGEKAQKHCLT